jgi:Lipase (class 2)
MGFHLLCSYGSSLLRRWQATLGILVTIAASLVIATPGVAAAAKYHVPYGNEALAEFFGRELLAPTDVVGANNGCKPSNAHPYPIVLVHGTGANEGSSWVSIAPLLANEGYCVYAFNYGADTVSLGFLDGINHIAKSAGELSSFVNTVLSETKASKVDLVGHSQGGMMPNYYIHFLGGASKVNELIGLAPSNHGSTLDGLTGLLTFLKEIPGVGVVIDGLEGSLETLAPAFPEQEENSAFMKTLFGSGEPLSSSVRYVVIESSHDEIVTPYTNAFLHAGSTGASVTNILIQEQCPSDPVGHIGMIWDSPVLQNILNQLGSSPKAGFKATCTNYGLSL